MPNRNTRFCVPFQLAHPTPQRLDWKTVTDAWNGYHRVPLPETDCCLTTFITPFGRWCYKRALQGAIKEHFL